MSCSLRCRAQVASQRHRSTADHSNLNRRTQHNSRLGPFCTSPQRQCRPNLHCGATDQSPDQTGPPVHGDWREFRARLIAEKEGDWSTRWTQENLHLLQQQYRTLVSRLMHPLIAQHDSKLVTLVFPDRSLAREGLWAHAIETPEIGGLLLATPKAATLLGDPRTWQLVICLLEHGPHGSSGLILNRPATAAVADILGWGFAAPKKGDTDAELMHKVFADNTIYLGGFYPPNKLARQTMTVLHGQSHLTGATEVAPGIYTGGEAHAAREILEGKLQANQFRFFAGCMNWGPGQLSLELNSGIWWLAACSRSLVLKQCQKLPVPLWREILDLMGGDYALKGRMETA